MARGIKTCCRRDSSTNREVQLMSVRGAALAGLAWAAATAWLDDWRSTVAWADSPADRPQYVDWTAVAPASEVERLRRLCKPLWGEMPAECFAALERLYVGRDVTRNWHSEPLEHPAGPRGSWTPLPVSDRIVWRDVFADPVALRRRVDGAAAKTQCHAMPGESRHELHDACAADAFARLSVLHRACGRILRWDGDEYHDGWAFEWAWERHWLYEDPRYGEDRARHTAMLDESELHFAWRLRKCRSVPTEAMSRVFALQQPPHQFGPYQNTELMVVAARLGSPWANTQLGAVAEEVNATATWDLPLAYIRRASGAAMGHNASASMYLPFLLVARDYDLRAQARFEWGALQQRFSQAELNAAHAIALQIIEDGWQPMAVRPDRGVDTWPWAIAPPVVETRFIARRYDRYGNLRWVYPNGAEHWFAPDGEPEMDYVNERGEKVVVSHTQIQTAGVRVRQWTDEAGKQRWMDKDGHEHWIDNDGAERWVDWGGTEWVLLPIGVLCRRIRSEERPLLLRLSAFA